LPLKLALGRDPNVSLFLDFLPSYLFTALSSFSWVCWIAPNNAKVNQLFGVSHGLAMGILTFDWGQIAFIGSPFPIPWWAAANIGFSVAFFYWFLLPILYVRPPCFCLSRSLIGFCSTPMFGTVVIFPWCHQYLSIIRGSSTTSLGSSTPISPSTSRLMRLTAPYLFLHPLPLPTVSCLQPSLPRPPTLSSTTANIYGPTLVAHSPNNLIFMPASCPCTRRSRIGGT
jgi:OPT oligopeptide transporter protein